METIYNLKLTSKNSMFKILNNCKSWDFSCKYNYKNYFLVSVREILQTYRSPHETVGTTRTPPGKFFWKKIGGCGFFLKILYPMKFIFRVGNLRNPSQKKTYTSRSALRTGTYRTRLHFSGVYY